MKIVHLVAGAGSMYCGSCLHGNTLAAALRAAGGDVCWRRCTRPCGPTTRMSPGRGSPLADSTSISNSALAVFRHTPWMFDRMLDHPSLLRWATRRGGATRPEGLGELTLSMLRGEEGRQGKELEKLLHWLEREIRPDVVHLSNVMLSGLARRIANGLPSPSSPRSPAKTFSWTSCRRPTRRPREELCRRAADLDALVAMNRGYADFMSEFLAVPRDRIAVIRPGLNLQGHAAAGRPRPPVNRPPTIGYLSRICPDKGLHLLVDAWKLLAVDAELPAVRLRAAGYLDPADRPYLDDLFAASGLRWAGRSLRIPRRVGPSGQDRLLAIARPDERAHVCRESKGLAVLEAWANGVPAVLPDHGAFPEMVADTGGGLLFAARRRGVVRGGGQTHDSRPAIGRRLRPPGAGSRARSAMMHDGWPRRPWTCTGGCFA